MVRFLMKDLENMQLIALVKAGDDLAFSELVSRYTPLINREISDFSIPTATEDELISEAYFALHSAAKSYDCDRHLTFGLYAKICIHNQLIDFARKASHVVRGDVDVEKISVTPKIASKLADAEDFYNILGISKSLLSDLEYKVLIYHVQGYKTAKIAEALATTPKAVDNAKNRLFTKLRTHFGTR